MTTAVPLRSGQINGAGATDAMFLKVFGGEIMTAFEESNKTLTRHRIRNISSGKQAQFPATWKVTAGYHTPGVEILGQTSNTAERLINVDDMLLSSVFLALQDEAMSHFETRQVYTEEMGRALANQWDRNVLQLHVLAARASATVTGGFGGTSLTSLTTLYRTSAVDLVSGLFAAAQAMDEKDIPEDKQKFCYVRPAQYYLLAQYTPLLDRDFNMDTPNGTLKSGKVFGVAGIEIVKTNHLPITSILAVSGQKNTYDGDFTKVAAVVATADAVGTVKLRDLATESQWDIRRQGTLYVAKYMVGHGILRPECAVELKTTT